MNRNLILKRFYISKEEYQTTELIMQKYKKVIDHKGREFKEMLIRELKLGAGHWFECPNGHLYAIGECGGAVSEGQCPDCGAIIGGSNYNLNQ